MVKISLLFIALLFTLACSPGNQSPAEKIPAENPKDQVSEHIMEQVSIETIATDLEVPWSIQKTEDTFYISEREGSIARIENQEVQREMLQLSKAVSATGEGGLLGFILDPNFSENQLAYAYHTYEENGQLFNRVIQLQRHDQQWSEMDTLLDYIPGSRIHNGGRIMIGPDKKLYVTTGDAAQPEWSQDLHTLAGKILRMELNGDIPEDNPFPDSYVYSSGHRNPQGLAWNREGSIMYSSEHGQTGHDEMNIIQPGKNYGWPIIQGEQTEAEMENPLFHSGEKTWAPSGIAYMDKQKLLVTGLRGAQLLQFDLQLGTFETILEGEGRLRDIMITQDSVYLITNNRDGRGNPDLEDDRLLRIDLRYFK